MTDILLLGPTGMLGKKVWAELGKNPAFRIYTMSRNSIPGHAGHYVGDINEEGRAGEIIRKINPGLVINCSGITDIRRCEEDKEYADRVHVSSTGVIIATLDKGSYYIHISTDSVFDGQTGNYKESDTPNPLNHYARSKLAGEKIALQHPRSLVIRVNIYGGESPGGNSLLEWGMKSFEKGEKVSGFDNVFFNPLYVSQLAVFINYLTGQPRYGVLHAGCMERFSKYQFLKTVMEMVSADINLLKKAAYDPGSQVIKRPMDTTLNIAEFAAFYNVPSIFDGIKEAIRDFREKRVVNEP